jgi:hypothetical protein
MAIQNPVFEVMNRANISLERLSKLTEISEGQLLDILHGQQLSLDHDILDGLSRVAEQSPERIQEKYEAWMYSQ